MSQEEYRIRHIDLDKLSNHVRKQGFLSEEAALHLMDTIRALTGALTKIDAIRNSIVGTHTVNWSAHIYPLIAALEEAGFEGQEYEVARAETRTLREDRDRLLALIREASEYLDTNNLTSIGSGSILHTKLKAVL